MQNVLMTLLIIAGSITAFILALIFIAVPLFRGIGLAVGGVFRLIGWFFMHIFEFIGGMFKDIIRFVGSIIAMIVLTPLVPVNIVIGRWSAAGHFANAVKRECKVGALCVYRFAIRRPLRLLLLDGLLEGLEQRVPEAVVDAPTSDKPGRRSGQFAGYNIIGSLRSGGSGAKLYVAEPTQDTIRKHKGMGQRVVIKCFALTEGSSLPQIVRESRALECAKAMGLVLDHGMDSQRFYYIMPYHPGDHLGVVTRQLHGESDGRALKQRQLSMVMGYMHDLLATLAQYHDGGLWHKDVKPDNVIIHDGRAHLVDLGLVTPLRSAMTLTTHGTEYFRDPEMVRQALRGVKVHQVNGAKFDIYAAGAVLYFMLENTFPAHGGLSRFVANSPEALRWIVRRSMTEYNQRYETAQAMLADLDYVAAAPDAFAVKPAELPSMRGAAADPMPHVHVVNATGMSDADAVDAVSNGRARAFSVSIPGVTVVAGGSPNVAAVGAGASSGGGSGDPFQRARLKIKNWWTGEYQVEQSPSGPAPMGAGAGAAPGAGGFNSKNFCGIGFGANRSGVWGLGFGKINSGSGSGKSGRDRAREFRAQAANFRAQAEVIARQARDGAISARKAAREQIRAARERARDLRQQARAHRQRVAGHSSESGWAVTIGTLSVLFLAAMIALGFLSSSRNASRLANLMSSANENDGRPVVIAVDCAEPLSDASRRNVESIIRRYKSEGYDVIVDAPDVATLLPAIGKWRKYNDRDSDTAIEDYLAKVNAYALVHVPITVGKRTGRQTVQDTLLIHSTAPDAEDRRRPGWLLGELPQAPSQPYLLINDHPTKSDPKVEAKVKEYVQAYHDRGWKVVVDDDAEVEVRKALPSGPFDPARDSLPPAVIKALAERGFAGIVRIDAADGNAPPQDRVRFTRVDAAHNLPDATTSNDGDGTVSVPPMSPEPPTVESVPTPNGTH